MKAHVPELGIWRERTRPDFRLLLARPWFHLFSITVIALLTYWGLQHAYFAADDYWMLGWVRFKANAWAAMMTEIDRGWALRPLMDLQLWLRTQLFGLNAAPYYWVSLGQHLLAVGLLYWLAVLLGLTRLTAWLAALLFSTTFAAYSVVHWITGSTYNLVFIPGLLALCLLILYRKRNRPVFLLLSVFAFGIALFTMEAFVSILPLLLLYDLVVTLPGLRRAQKARKLLTHLWYLPWLIAYYLLYVNLAAKGGSEYSGLSVGPHILSNYVYLAHMMLPNIADSSVAAYLNSHLPGEWFALYTAAFWFLAAALLLVSGYLLWRGTRVQRFLVLWIFLAFSPFSLWSAESGLSAGIRYRYVPAMAFCMLLALGLRFWWRHPWLVRKKLHLIAPMFVVGLLLLNIVFHQLYNRQEIRTGETKQQVVKQLQELDSPPAGAQLVFDIPSIYFSDLRRVCELLYSYPVACTTCLHEDDCPPRSAEVYLRLKVRLGTVEVTNVH